MKRDLMDILVCPVCRSELDLTVSKEEEDEIVDGSLKCKACGETYPIENTIPNLLPPSLRD
ncbi:methytransferase partner Trm112 [Dehalococcoidia bacterium]|nr:methytransferase partner Trm112 [Dehalococcoidia bacterium]